MNAKLTELFKHPVLLKAAGKFGKPDRLEHVGYLAIMAFVEHNALRLLALLVLAVVLIACWLANE